MEPKKILITVKTYPNLSTSYDELVCTAGVLEDGSWIRLYPIPFRRMGDEKQYKKYDWIEIDVQKNKQDMRPESFTPNWETIKKLDHIDTKYNWRSRKAVVLRNIHEKLTELINLAHENKLSLTVFKAKRFIAFTPEKIPVAEHGEYRQKMGTILESRKQMKLMDDGLKDIEPVSKPDYRFYYEFEDRNGKTSRMMIEDWEIQALYRNCLSRKGNKAQALEDVCKKYWDDFAITKDLYVILGTTLEFHRRKAKNPFTIIGTFTPKKEK